MIIESEHFGKTSIMDFSAAICVYHGDNAEYFDRALSSMINQTVPASEIVLVVDGPVSEALNLVISKYSNLQLFKTIRLTENVGHGNARRIALANCKFDLVALMDADDICLPNRFEKQLASITQYPEVSVIGSNIQEFIGPEDNIIAIRKVPSKNIDIYRYMKRRCPFNQMTVMLRKSHVNKAGGYLDWHYNEDYYLWIRMSLHGCIFHNVENALVKVRVGNEMYARRGGKKYFLSEYRLQKFMLEKKIINLWQFAINVAIRLAVQVIMPNRVRALFFRRIARKSI